VLWKNQYHNQNFLILERTNTVCETMKLFETSALTGSFMSKVIIDVLRGILNRALKETNPMMLVQAITNDDSLWGETNGDIMSYVQDLPPFVADGIRESRVIIDNQYGGFGKIVLQWLEEDHPLYYNIIKNTPDNAGIIWIEKQITEILDGVEINVNKKNRVK
jgi:hypothetical protein